MRPRVLLDCDGVLSDFTAGALEVVEDITGRRYTHDDVHCFDFCAALGLDTEQAAAVKRRIGARRGFCASLPVLPGAFAGVRQLREIADVYIVTSPWNSNPTWTHEREAWLERHFKIRHSNVVHTSAKYLVDGDVFVDDRAPAVSTWAAAHPRGIAVHWQTPHNLGEMAVGRATSSWEQLCQWVGGPRVDRALAELAEVTR